MCFYTVVELYTDYSGLAKAAELQSNRNLVPSSVNKSDGRKVDYCNYYFTVREVADKPKIYALTAN